MVVARPVHINGISAAAREAIGGAGPDQVVVVIEPGALSLELIAAVVEAGLDVEVLCAAPQPDLIARLEAAGLETSAEVYLAYDQHRPALATDHTVQHVDGAELDSAYAAAWGRRRREPTEEQTRRPPPRVFYERACEVSYHAIGIGGAWVSRCECYLLDGVASLGGVMTDPPFQGRGFASAVILDAVAHSRARGATFWRDRLLCRGNRYTIGRYVKASPRARSVACLD